MKSIKIIFALLLVLALILPCFAACNQSGQTKDTAPEKTGEISSYDTEITTVERDETTTDGATASDATLEPGVTTVPEATTSPEATTAPESTTSSEATSAPEVTTADTPVVTEPPHTHSYSSVWSKSATQHWHECACGDKADSAAHSFGEWVTIKAATETAQGSKKHTCTVCGFEETQAIPTLDHKHSFSTEWSKSDVQHWHECSCGEKKDQSAHSFGGWTVTKEPTCTAEGSKKHVCTVCGYEETATVEKKAHTPAVDPAVPATCTESGKTEGSHCSVCNAVLAVQQTVPATGHSFGEWNVTKAATCTEKGEEQCSCSVCHTTQSRDIDALGHNYVDTVVPPTATVDGYTEHKCSRCNDFYRDTIVEATGSIGLAYRDNGDGTCTIIGIGTCQDHDIIVPKKIDNLIVIEIGENAFENQTSITSLQLPDSIVKLGRRAFKGCSSLKKTNIPKSVNTIESQVFYNSGIETVLYCCNVGFPENESVFTGTPLKRITFCGNVVPMCICYNCLSLVEVEILDGVESIEYRAFLGCSSLSLISLTKSVSSIASSFSGSTNPKTVSYSGSLEDWCKINRADAYSSTPCVGGATLIIDGKILKDAIIPETIKTINPATFSYCSSLESVSIQDSVESIGAYAFFFCNKMTTISIPDSVQSIGNFAFRDCISLTDLFLPDSVNSIGQHAFWRCSSLASINIPKGITSMYCALDGCSGLKKIFIPVSITSIQGESLYGATVFYEGTEQQWNSIKGNNIFTNCTIIFCSNNRVLNDY